MGSNATNFTKSRQDNSTHARIKAILSYIMECHKLFLNDGIQYSESVISDAGTVMFEDHLKFEFVENYLIKNKHLLKGKISELEEINFACETQQRYKDVTDGDKIKPDKIDIYVNKLGLQEVWNQAEEYIYFALECKRIKIKSDTKEYVQDIAKFANRNHINLRLPFEGQIAFIENKNLDHTIVSDAVNDNLKAHTSIVTDIYLTSVPLHSTIGGTYLSEHKKNFGVDNKFSIYHLMFDYTKVVVK